MSDMPVTRQMSMLREHASELMGKNPDFDPETIDYESEIDPTLSYSENLDEFKRRHGLNNAGRSDAEYKDDFARARMNQAQREGYQGREKYAGKSMSDIIMEKHNSGDVLSKPQYSTSNITPNQKYANTRFFETEDNRTIAEKLRDKYREKREETNKKLEEQREKIKNSKVYKSAEKVKREVSSASEVTGAGRAAKNVGRFAGRVGSFFGREVGNAVRNYERRAHQRASLGHRDSMALLYGKDKLRSRKAVALFDQREQRQAPPSHGHENNWLDSFGRRDNNGFNPMKDRVQPQGQRQRSGHNPMQDRGRGGYNPFSIGSGRNAGFNPLNDKKKGKRLNLW